MKSTILKTLLDFFRSVKVAIVLLIYIAAASTLTTLIPQGNEITFYQQSYNPFLSWLILSTGLHNFFSSFLFLMPVVLFIINLIVCMLSRFIRELLDKQKKRFGPDIIHLGILLLIISSFVTFFLKQEHFFYMNEGEQVILAQKYILTLKSFEEIRYPDGRPKEWISTVSVKKNNKEIKNSFSIEVNKPLELNGLAVYQFSYYNQRYIVLEDSTGKEIQLPEGHPIPDDTNTLFFIKALNDEYRGKGQVVIIEQRENNRIIRQYEYPVGSYIRDYLIKKTANNFLSGLQVVADPGFLPIIISFIIISAGLIIIFIQKIGDNKL